MSTNEMTDTVREYKELKAYAEQIADELAALEDKIKAEMAARNTEEMTVDVFKVRWTTVNSTRFDTAAFKKAMPKLAEQFTKATTTRRFSIA